MTDFTVESGVRIPDREKREAKRDLEQSIGDVTIDVDATQGGPGRGGSSTASLAGGAGVFEALDDQTDILTEIHDELKKIGASGGGGGGGGGSLFGGGSGFALGSALSGGAGGIAGTILSKGKGALGAIRGSAGLATRALGRSPYTMMAETWGKRDIASRAGSDRSGFVTGTMTDIATGEFQLKEDFWPNLSPPDDLWGGVTDALSPPQDLWGIDLSPPNDLWGIDLSPPEDLWGIDLSPPDDLWGFDLSPPDGFWSNILPGGGGSGKDDPVADIPGSGKNQPQSDNTPGSKQKESMLSATYGDYDPSQGPSQTSESSSNYETGGQQERMVERRKEMFRNRQQTGSTSGSETRVDVQVQEIRAQIESGRALEDAIRGEMDSIAPDIKHEVLTQLREEMPSRL